jgi:hypothetical protein
MPLETKFLRLRTPVTLGSRLGDWQVTWLGGWGRYQLYYLVMVVKVQPLHARPRRVTAGPDARRDQRPARGQNGHRKCHRFYRKCSGGNLLWEETDPGAGALPIESMTLSGGECAAGLSQMPTVGQIPRVNVRFPPFYAACRQRIVPTRSCADSA